MTKEKFILGFGFGISLFILYSVGYTMQFSQTVFYLVILLIVSNEVFKEVKQKNKERKDYLFAINDLNIGGAEVGMVDVVNELINKGQKVDIVLLRKQGPLLDKVDKKVNIYEILNKNYSPLKNKIYYILYMLGGIFTKYVYSKTIKCNYNTEIAYLEGYPAVFISASTNPNSTKVASIRVGLKNHKLKAAKLPWGEFRVKQAYKKIDNVYTVSDLTTKEFLEKYPFCKTKTTTIYTYFNLEDMRKKAQEKFVLLELDYPQKRKQSDEVKKMNQKLATAYQIEGFPTVVFADAKGTPVWSFVGGRDKASVMRELDTALQKGEALKKAREKAAKAIGDEKIMALAEVMKLAPQQFANTEFYSDVEKELLALDIKDISGYKKQKEELAKQKAVEAAREKKIKEQGDAFMKKLQGVSDMTDTKKISQLLDEFEKEYKDLEPEIKQIVAGTRVQLLVLEDEINEARNMLKQLIPNVSNEDVENILNKMKAAAEKQKAQSKETPKDSSKSTDKK